MRSFDFEYIEKAVREGGVLFRARRARLTDAATAR